MPTMSRRGFLAATGILALSACSSNNNTSSTNENQAGLSPAPIPDIARRPLPIPHLMLGGTYELTAQVGSTEIEPGVMTNTCGYNGNILGPTLRVRRNQDVSITVHNNLPEETALHCHGLLVPAKSDGGPHSAIPAGDTWTAEFTVEQPAATLWYHPHPHGKTGLQAYRGLAGMIIIDDDVSTGLDLPKTYGEDDIPVVLTDAKLTADGQLDETLDPDLGLLGDTVVINGITNPEFKAKTGRVRLRIINGSTMRFHNLGLSTAKPFHVIATDAGLLEAPKEVTTVGIGPGERLELLIDTTEDVMLRSVGFSDNLGVPEDGYAPDFRLTQQNDLLLIRGNGVSPTSDIPAELDPTAAKPVDTSRSITRDFALNTFEINGQSMDMNRVDVVIDHSDPEIWTVTNENSDWIHNFHIHNAAFKVADVTGTTVAFDHFGWKDTVTLPPGATVTLHVLFGQYRDNTYPYMFHCHMLYHEDQGMMGQFMMVNKGEVPNIDTAYTRGEVGQAQHHH